MTPARATVFGGNNLGEATVLQSGLNRNINLIDRAQKQINANEKFKRDREAKNRGLRAKQFKEAVELNPEVNLLPYVDHIRDRQIAFQDEVAGMFVKHELLAPEQQAEVENKKTNILTDVRKINLLEKQMRDQFNLAKANEEVNENFVSDYLANLPYGEGDKVIDINELDADQVDKWLDFAGAYNVPVQAKNFAESVEEEIRSEVRRNGDTFDEIQVKSKFIKGINPSTNELEYNITPELAALWKRDHGRSVTLKSEVGKLREVLGVEGTQGELERLALERILHGQGVFEERINRQNAPRDRGFGGRRNFDDLPITESDDFELANFENARDGVVGSSGRAIETPNIVKDIEFNPNELSTVQGFGVDNNGDFVIRTTVKKASNKVQSKNVKASDNNLSKIRNALKNPDERASFDRLVNRLRKEIDNSKPLIIDEPKLTGFVNDISSSVKASGDDSQEVIADDIRKKLLDVGIEETVKIEDPFFGSKKLRVGSETFDLAKEADKERLQKYIFNKTKTTRQFVATQGDNEEVVKPDPNSKKKKVPGLFD